MRCLTSLALLASAAPAVLALDEGSLLQASAFARENILEAGVGVSNLTQYGKPMQLTVRPAHGADIPVSFRSGLRLQVLMHSVCGKLSCKVASANFSKAGRPLDPASTAASFGLTNGDVVEVSTPMLLQEAAEAKVLLARKEMSEKLMQQQHTADKAREAVRDERRRKVTVRVAKRQAEEARRHKLQLKDEITLKFISPTGGEDVTMGVKRGNWLEGYLELVAKRFGVKRSEALFLFKDDDGALSAVEPHDTVRTLGLEDDERIVVKIVHGH